MRATAAPTYIGALHATLCASNLILLSGYCGAFTAYIVVTYALDGAWHRVDDHGLGEHDPVARVAIIAHFCAGSLLTLVAPLQFVTCLRQRWPFVHRWSGRVAIACALVVALGGLVYAVGFGTIGGWSMNLAFSTYGLCLGGAAAATITTARRLARYRRTSRSSARTAADDHDDMDVLSTMTDVDFVHGEIERILARRHQLCARLLFSLALGSPLYRGYYAAAQVYFGYAPPTAATPERYLRPFDQALLWLFFVPQVVLVLVAHAIGQRIPQSFACLLQAMATLGIVALLVAAVFVSPSRE